MIDRQNGDVAPGARPLSWWLVDEYEIAGLIAQHATLRELCNELEACADELPGRAAIACAVRIAAAFTDVLQRHEAAEQAVCGGFSSHRATGILPDRIRHFHAVDRLHAEDLHEALVSAAHTFGPVKADMLSYMMRCLFEGCRRGIDLQEAGVLLLGRGRLTSAARLAVMVSLTGPASLD